MNAIDEWLSANADFFFGDQPTVNDPDDVTSLTLGGKIGATLVRSGASGTIQVGPDGLVFPGGRTLQLLSGLSGAYEGALVIADVTAAANPSALAVVVRVDNDGASRHILRQGTTGLWQGIGPNNGSFTVTIPHPNGQRHVIGFLTDPQQRHMSGAHRQAFIERDGYVTYCPATGTPASLDLNTLLIGQNFVGTIHRMAIFLIPLGGSLPDTIQAIRARMAGVPEPSYASGAIDLMLTDGQSLAVGPNITAEEESAYNALNRHSVLMLTGLFDANGSPVTSMIRPNSKAYNTAVPAAGSGPSLVDTRLAPVHVLAAALSRFRGDGSNRLLIHNHAISGEEIGDFDASVVTGSGATVIYQNNAYWHEQAAARLAADGLAVGTIFKALVQGTADSRAAAGYWKARALAWWNDHTASTAASFPGKVPVLILGQSGGSANTVTATEDWHVCGEQLDLASEIGGVLVPEYPFRISDNNVHPSLPATVLLAETMAWAARTHETGGDWNLGRPIVARNAGVITLTYPAWATMELAPDAYSGQGIENYGFEVVGAPIVYAHATGNVVTLVTCGGTPTGVRYAMQAQDVTGFAGNAYTAHRGLLRTTARQTGPISGEPLYQCAPSFRALIESAKNPIARPVTGAGAYTDFPSSP